MNKKLLELLDKINQKKADVRTMVEAGDLDGAKTAKAELQKMQEAFDLSKDLYDAGPSEPTKPITGGTMDAVKSFAAAARAGFRNATTTINETTGSEGGYTVPEDVQTQINEYRSAEFSLQDLVDVVPVHTLSGARTYKKKSTLTGFTAVGEGAKIPQSEQPAFERLAYTIKKYGGWLPVTNETLADSDANLTAVITKWLASESRATRNKLILAALTEKKESTYTTIKNADGLTKALNITLGAAYKATSAIITNDYGLQEMCEWKDGNGRPLLNPNPSDPAKMQLAAGPVIVPVKVIPVSDMPNITDSAKTYAPIIVGDLKEAVALFDRQQITLKSSDTASVTGFNSFEEDLTLFRAIEREDVEIKDADAYVLGHFSTAIA